MSSLDQERDHCTDHQNRLEPFAQNDQEGLEERLPVSGRSLLRKIDDRGKSIRDRIARGLRPRDVLSPNGSLEAGEVAFHRRNEAGLLRARRSLERLERDVCIEGAIAGLCRLTVSREIECAVE